MTIPATHSSGAGGATGPDATEDLVVLVQHDGVETAELPRLHPADEPLLSAFDLGVVRGDGCFETLLLAEGYARKVGRHLRRLESSQRMLGIDGPDARSWERAIEFAVAAWGRRDRGGVADEAMLRLVLTRGQESGGAPTAYITVVPVGGGFAELRRSGIRLMTQQRGFSVDLAASAPWQLLGAKTLSYATNMASQRHARAEGFDDVLYLSAEGDCLEGPRSTLVISRDGGLVSPPTDIGVLVGTTFDALAEVAEARGIPVSRERLRVQDLHAADGVWMVSSIARALRVTSLDGTTLAAGESVDVESLVDEAISGSAVSPRRA